MRCCSRGAAAQPQIPKNRRSDSGESATTHVHTIVAYLYSEAPEPAAAPPGRHVRTFQSASRVPEDAVPFGFCSGGFTSTSSLRSGQRGSTEVERRRYPEADHVLRGAVAFLSARPGSGLPAAPCAKPFGFGVGVNSSRLTARLLPSSVVSPRRPPIPSPVTAPLRTATGGGLYARPRGLSSTFSKKFFGPFFGPLSRLCPHSETSSTGDFHRWKFHAEFVT